jgi:hypothetical protein
MTGVICGLLFLTRGEGILVLITLICAYLIRSRSEGTLFTAEPLIKGSRLLIGFLGPVLSWSVYAYFTFGRFLPDTLSAKMAQRQTGLWQSFPERMFREWLPLWERDFAPAAAPVLNLWWVLVLLGLFLAFTRKRRWLIFLGWIILYILGYSILNVSGYTWYQLPVYFVAQLFFAIGLIKAAETLLNLPDLELPGRVAMSCLLIFVFYTLAKPNIRYLQDDSVDPKVTSYLQLTDWLRANTHSVESVAYIEVGYLGYFTDNRIIDLAGLITPAVIPYVSQGDFASGFWQYQPDYYVYWPDFDWALGQIRRDPRFEAHYQPVASLLGPSDNNLTIYKRVTQAQQ